ncbi:type I glutamate--ammonia ligase [Telmatocola sphagniphila]|uniref:Type I glutamate--ammonia ligase n=1 Tax=Telmatocola sphagniphila TaxID=1123043 RepID=A0A8E6B6N0_9BACT|nr:type I glutamate--ammonia ligase [Telmatocola sphagniphila]QVL32877.1 type I glutamate--ammonia ligase [Telmatocola sphagniphila]
MTPKEILALIREKEVKAVDFRFMDFPGLWQHFTIPAEILEEATFEEGIGFDGSSLRGWQSINEADMLVVPVPNTAFIDPFCRETTLTLICNIQDPLTKEDYSRDPRNVARKAYNYMRAGGICDKAYFGPEVQFFVFDDIRFDQNTHSGYYQIDSVEGAWNTGRDERPNLGHKLRYKEGYSPCPPSDAMHDLRSEMMLMMMQCGLTVEAHRHEAATAGQGEVGIRYDELVKTADNVLKYKYVVKNVARRNQKTATFMPKPLYQEYGSGMNVHLSLWKNGTNLFAGSRYAGLSEMAEYAIGGLLKHAPALCAFTNPTTNSYKRLVPGFEAPISLAYSQRNRSAAIRIPVYSPVPKNRRIEYRLPDAAGNPYLVFAAMLMAVLDGIKNKIAPGEPLDKDIYDLGAEELSKVPPTPGSLEESLSALKADHEFLLQGGVFTEDVIETWIKYKHQVEVEAIRTRPHPYEFALYYDM